MTSSLFESLASDGQIPSENLACKMVDVQTLKVETMERPTECGPWE